MEIPRVSYNAMWACSSPQVELEWRTRAVEERAQTLEIPREGTRRGRKPSQRQSSGRETGGEIHAKCGRKTHERGFESDRAQSPPCVARGLITSYE